jgi:type IV pilus assembly protein PilE
MPCNDNPSSTPPPAGQSPSWLNETYQSICAVNGPRGFTLLELLVALALVGILATLAWPGYRDSLMRARRADGIDALLALQLAQEKFRGHCARYAQTLGNASACGGDTGVDTLQAAATSAQKHYALSVHSGSANPYGYTLVATPLGIQADDRLCAPLLLSVDASNPQGVRMPAACW